MPQFAIPTPNPGSSLMGSVAKEESWFSEGLVIVVIGASGDLAKKKTYPSLFNLFRDKLLPEGTIIWGYARSKKTHQSLRLGIRPYLLKSAGRNVDENVIDDFLSKCFYTSGTSYGDLDAYANLNDTILHHESMDPTKCKHNRLFYMAIPPNVFGETGLAIKKTAMAPKGWTRTIIEKPFGRDLESCVKLLDTLAENFDEDDLYRIDHYLGKEIVQNLLTLRFGNSWLELLLNRNAVASVVINFKEPFGTEGRGGYFDQYGIIRDVIQNHLLQVLTLLTMEPPAEFVSPDAGDSIRDAKTNILKAIPPIKLEECLLGQYEGYTDDPTITNKETNSPTFAAVRMHINTAQWDGVPFVLTAGKALNEKKCEIRIQLKDDSRSKFMTGKQKLRRNELVMCLQPKEAIYMTTNIKSPGFSSIHVQAEMRLDYHEQFDMDGHPDAYTRLILDTLRGNHGGFVRDDELKRSWEIFTPLLHQIESENVRPVIYKCGSNGPEQLSNFLAEKSNYISEDKILLSSL